LFRGSHETRWFYPIEIMCVNYVCYESIKRRLTYFSIFIFFIFLFYYESRKRELKTRLMYEDRCDERLKN
jgi:hypothetical protein